MGGPAVRVYDCDHVGAAVPAFEQPLKELPSVGGVPDAISVSAFYVVSPSWVQHVLWLGWQSLPFRTR